MFTLFQQSKSARPTDRMAHDLMDGLDGPGRLRRVIAVGDEAVAVAAVLRERLPGSVVIAVHAVEALGQWVGWADLIVAAWAPDVDARGLAHRLRAAAHGGATVAVLDRGEIDLVDALQQQFAPVSWAIESPAAGGPPILSFVGRTAA